MRKYSSTLQVKLLKSAFLTVALPAFVLLVAFYVAWSAYVRARIARDLERTTSVIARRIADDLGEYETVLSRLAADPTIRESFFVTPSEASFSRALGEIYASLKGHGTKAVFRGIDGKGRVAFGTFEGEEVADEEGFDPTWGFFGLMGDRTGRVVGYQRALKYGKVLQTDYSIGAAIADGLGGIAGYVTADLSFLASRDPASKREGGPPGPLVLTNGLDRVVASYNGSAAQPFERFALGGEKGEVTLGDARYAYVRADLGRQGLRAYGLASVEALVSSFRSGLYSMGAIIAVSAAVFALSLARSIGRITRPVREMMSTMRKVSRGDFSARLEVASGDELEEIAGGLNSLIVDMETTVKRLMRRIDQSRTAEMKQLQAQFNPHFLYNTLDSAKWLMQSGQPEKASSVLSSLAQVLRYSIHDRAGEAMVPIEEDFAAINTYLDIHRLCMGDKLKVLCELDREVGRCRIPKFLMQPVIENALVHGIGPKGRGRIAISVRGDGGRVVAAVSDDGVGFPGDPREIIRAASVADGRGSGIGFGLVLRRARLYFGDAFSFDARSSSGKGSVVALSFPMKRLEKEGRAR